MVSHGLPVRGVDVPIVKLLPRNEREISKTRRQRIEASIRAVGLIEPLLVYPHGDDYEILDGCLRYRILLDFGVENVPCLLADEREGFTANRMVNQLSPAQESRMLRNSLEELDESTIASALGMSGIAHRLHAGLLKKLHPTVTKAFEAAKITLRCTRELAHVKPERQAEILALMESCNDYSITFARGMILKTQVAKRAKTNGTKTPWTQADDQKNDLLKRLREAEQQQDFYSGLYRQYTTNLLKLVIYVRSLLANERVRAYLETHHGELVKVFVQIVSSTREMMPRNGWSAGSETCAPEVTACSPRRCECVNRRCIGAPGKCSAVGRPRCASRRSTRRAFIPIPENISPIGNRCCRCWRTDSARGCRFAGVKCARITRHWRCWPSDISAPGKKPSQPRVSWRPTPHRAPAGRGVSS